MKQKIRTEHSEDAEGVDDRPELSAGGQQQARLHAAAAQRADQQQRAQVLRRQRGPGRARYAPPQAPDEQQVAGQRHGRGEEHHPEGRQRVALGEQPRLRDLQGRGGAGPTGQEALLTSPTDSCM